MKLSPSFCRAAAARQRVWEASIPVLTSKALHMAVPLPSLPEPPPLPAKPTKPSNWWMLLLIIPAIATGLAVVASQFQPAKNFRRRWTSVWAVGLGRVQTVWQARLVIRHEGVKDSGSYEVKFSDGRPPKFFNWDDDPSQRVRPGVLTSEQALEKARAFADATGQGA